MKTEPAFATDEIIADVVRAGAVRRAIEAELVPMRAVPASTIPLGPNFSYELKLDGIRCIAEKMGSRVLLHNRHGREITRVYPDIVNELSTHQARDFVVDGEIVAFDERGIPSFKRIAERAHLYRAFDIRSAARRIPATFVAFDVLGLGEYDLRTLPLHVRRGFLRRTISETKMIRIVDVFESNPQPLLAFCREHRLEGIVAKRNDSQYRSGPVRSDDWVKWKNDRDDDFVIVGYTVGEGARTRMGAIDVASYDAGKFIYRGKVGSGLDERAVDMLLARLLPLRVDAPTAIGEYHPARRGRVHVRPEVVVSVKYGDFSEGGSLRFPVFRGIRDDVEPEECTLGPNKSA
jgi:bifunctional non-homologous end joining protein LigD